MSYTPPATGRVDVRRDLSSLGLADADAIQAGAALAEERNVALFLRGGVWTITKPVDLPNRNALNIRTDGVVDTVLRAAGNFETVLRFLPTAAEHKIEQLSVDTTGTTTKCVVLQEGSQAIRFTDCGFRGDGAGPLVSSRCGGFLDFEWCNWDCNGAGTIGLELDRLNLNNRVWGGRFGGIGCGFSIVRNGAGQRAEGVHLIGVQFVTTGVFSASIGDSYETKFVGCNLDQASTFAVSAHGGCERLQIHASWLGLAAGSAGNVINIDASAGGHHKITDCDIYGGALGVAAQASAARRITGLDVRGCTFDAQSNAALHLDSVLRARIAFNEDMGAPASGSWYTARSHSPGSYTFDGNDWHTTPPALFDQASAYKWGSDTPVNQAGAWR